MMAHMEDSWETMVALERWRAQERDSGLLCKFGGSGEMEGSWETVVALERWRAQGRDDGLLYNNRGPGELVALPGGVRAKPPAAGITHPNSHPPHHTHTGKLSTQRFHHLLQSCLGLTNPNE